MYLCSVSANVTLRPAALTFLRGLARNNRKPWFEARRDAYERELRVPFRALVEEMDVRLARFAPEFIGDPRRSMFRIHRDVRFSKDKSPYKTNAACHFFHRDARHGAGQDAEGASAGFYFQLQPGMTFAAAGIWMPPRSALSRIRETLADDLDGFEEIVSARAFTRAVGALDEEAMLTRMPRGYPTEHPAAAWLRFQSFTVTKPFADREALGPGLPARLEKAFLPMLPFVRWLNAALGLKPAAHR
jgi:uncharacterized protein (TIGR02453 family)